MAAVGDWARENDTNVGGARKIWTYLSTWVTQRIVSRSFTGDGVRCCTSLCNAATTLSVV